MSNKNTSSDHSVCTDNTEYTRSRDHRKSKHSSDSYCSEDYTYTDTRDCYDYNNDSCESKRRKNRKHCDDDCGLKYSHTPVGVWNLVFQYETMTTGTATTASTLERPTQLLLNADGTFTNHSTPDLKNNPFMELLSTGVGVWHEEGDRKLKLEATHIGYKASDGSPVVYYKVHITMKLNRKHTKARFCGHAAPKDLKDPTLCTSTTGPVVCFSGSGYKVLEPKKCD